MFRRVLGLCVALVAALAVVSAPGAATSTHTGTPINVSTRAAVIQYLRTIDVNPRGVVIQRGARNYAGAHCPGLRWTCTKTTHPVVQVASAGGRNVFRCSTARCTVVQFAAPSATATSTAVCIKTSGMTQQCTINQNSATSNNRAVVYQDITSSVGMTQNARSTASITQTAAGASNSNEACVYQGISLDRSDTMNGHTVSLTQSAHQTVTIKQDSASGGNSAAESATPGGQCTGSSITQSQTLSSNLTAPNRITQEQNAADGGPNVTVDIEQNQSAGFLGTAHGMNSANFDQYSSLTAVANTPLGPVSQTQSSVGGGLLGTVNQDSRDVSTAVTNQTEVQCEDAAMSGLTACHTGDPDASEAPPVLLQTQFGPIRKGVGTATQTGNSGDTFSISQSSTQDDDQGSGSSQTNDLEADCVTDGICTVNQSVVVNDGETSSNFDIGQNLFDTITCKGSDCSVSGGGE